MTHANHASESPRRLLEKAVFSIQSALSVHEHREHISLLRTDLLQARELIDLALSDLEQSWHAQTEIARATLEGIDCERETFKGGKS
jgi:hypothetical protein